MRKLVSFAINQKMFFGLLMTLFLVFGVTAYRNLPIEAFPDVTDVQVIVITLFPGRAAEEVEKQVTIPLEIGLSGIPHAVRTFSHTQFGLSFIPITFDDNVDAYFARQQVLERINSIDLPEGVKPELAPLATPVGELFRYELKGGGLNATELRSIQDWTVARALKVIPGVAEVVSRGGFIKQYEASLDLAKTKSYNIPINQIITALRRGNANAGGSYLDQGEQQFLIRGLGLLRSADDISNVVVAERSGTPILIKEIAQVKQSFVPRQGIVGRDDADEVVTGIVLMRKGENPSEVLKGVRARIDELNANGMPGGVKIDPFYDRTWLINTTLTTVFKNLTEGAALVAVVLFVFLGNFRAAAIVALIIPLSLLATFIGLSMKGIPANLLSLGAMDFGIIVDGAVIVVENIFRNLSEDHSTHRTPESFKEKIIDAAAQVGRPTLFAMLIVITAHLPIFGLQRHEGRIFAPMAYTVVSALVGSLLFSLTLVPLLAYFLLRKPLPHEDNWVVRTAKRLYRPVLVAAMGRPYLVLAVAVASLAFSLSLVPKLGSEFLPELNEGTMWVNMTISPGTSIGETTKLCHKVRNLIRKFPEVETVISQAGRPEDGTDPKTLNMVEMFVGVKPPDQWKRNITKDQLVEQISDELDSIPGIFPSVSMPIRDSVLESISQIDGQIVIKVFGDDPVVLRENVQKILKTISPVRGVARAFIDRFGEVPQLQISVDRQKAARYGLNVADIEDVIEVTLGGKQATEIWEGEKKFGAVVRLKEEERQDISSIKKILVDTPNGQRIPLDEVTDVTIRSGSMNISREAGKTVASIGVFIKDRDMGSLVAEMRERVGKNVQLPPGYYSTWGGEFENQERAMARLLIILPASVFLIFVILFEAFKSFKNAALILLNVPFAMIGGIVALLFTGLHLSVSAAIGFIALFGQAVLNGVVMVSYFNDLREHGASAKEAATQGAMVRLRTVLMTSCLAMLGLLPMALSKGIGSEVQKPLAVVIIGGLVSATILTLIVLPTLYLVMEKGRDKETPEAGEGI
ncbi:MAG: efflux RND transporter permease subunit [Acidobacteria bacterium]|nr:efflux RND transporter permease subunit [Acidobacteriota bacterium]